MLNFRAIGFKRTCLRPILILPAALPCLDSELEQHHCLELGSLRLSEVLSIWEPSRRGLQRCHFLDSQSRPSSWSSCPSPGPHWSVACSLKAHSSETLYAIKWQDIIDWNITPPPILFHFFPNFKCLWGPPRLVKSSSPSGYILPRSPPVAYWVGFFIFFQSVFWETP